MSHEGRGLQGRLNPPDAAVSAWEKVTPTKSWEISSPLLGSRLF